MKEERKRTGRRRRQKNDATRYEIGGVILFLFGLFICAGLVGWPVGSMGRILEDGFRFLFGRTALLPGIVLVGVGIRYILTGRPMELTRKYILASFLYVFLISLYHQLEASPDQMLAASQIMAYGGAIAAVLVSGLRKASGNIGTYICLFGLILIDIVLLMRWSLSSGARKVGQKTEEKLEAVGERFRGRKEKLQENGHSLTDFTLSEMPKIKDFIFKKKSPVNNPASDDELTLAGNNEGDAVDSEATADSESGVYETGKEDEDKESDISKTSRQGTAFSAQEMKSSADEPVGASQEESINKMTDGADSVSMYQFPPLELLHKSETAVEGSSPQDKTALLERTLQSFGVSARVVNVSTGPAVTRYELRPEAGVRVSRIEGLSSDLALALAAPSIRIEAPIPGKPVVGIEIPNRETAEVPLRDVLESKEFQKGKGNILVALGKDITGKPVVTDISKMPHLLIAGSTGSGKSVCINSIITSIIYHSRPDEVKLMLIDPKVVELSVYNGIPHLRTEVVTDMKKAQGVLNWAVREMEARYQLFADARVRNIGGYNATNPEGKMSYIVIIIDEFADLMNVASKEVEVLIQRITQKARAAGIHLILATQRPSADVITGVIKSNIPSRIAFMVESALNSRIILDEGGAETLLGKGDMLFKRAGALNTVRIQGAFISDNEVENVVEYVKAEAMKQEQKPIAYEPIDLSVPDDSTGHDIAADDETDELFETAAEWVLDTKRASVSALQRRFRIGYTRAGRLMDLMEARGIVGPAEGAKPRDILINRDQLAALLSMGEFKNE